MYHHLITYDLCKVPTSHILTQSFHCHYQPIIFVFFIANMKGMGEFGFTVIHVSFKSFPSGYYVDQNVCNKCMEETFQIPPEPYTCSRLYCSELYWQCRQQLTIGQKTQIRTTFFEFTSKTSTIEPQFALNQFLFKFSGFIYSPL